MKSEHYSWTEGKRARRLLGIGPLDMRFKNVLPPLTATEREALERSIQAEGCRDPLIVWETRENGADVSVLIDGYNRYEACAKYRWPVRLRAFVHKGITTNAQMEQWIINNQLSRRNLTDAQREEFIGRLYNAEKKNKTENLKNGTNFPKAQNEPSGKKANSGEQNVGATVPVARPDNTAERVAKEQGVSKDTVKRAAKFADAVARVEKVSPEAASKIRNEKSVLPRGEVRALADAPEEAVKQAAKAIVEDKPLAPKPKPPAPKPAVGATLAVAPAPVARPSSEPPKYQTLDGQIFRMVEEIKNRLEVLDGLLPRRGELRGECMESVPNIMRSLQHDANNTFRRWMGDSAITTIIDHIAGGCDYLERLLDGDKAKNLTDYNIEEIIAGVKSNLTAHNVLLKHAVVVRDKRGGGNGGNV